MLQNSTVVPRAGCKQWVAHPLPALGLDVLAQRTIARSSSGQALALETSGCVRTSSRLVGKIGETEALARREAQRLILPSLQGVMEADLCRWWWGMDKTMFAAQSPAGFPSLDRDTVAAALQCCRRTLIVSEVAGIRVAVPMCGSPGDHKTSSSS
jgi:hypothetical protein